MRLTYTNSSLDGRDGGVVDWEQNDSRATAIRLVIADDHAIVREPLRAWFESEEPDFAVIGEAANGAEAIRYVQELRPDILLLDVCMPGVDGLEVARVLAETVPETRIVVLTGYDDTRRARAFVELGVAGYLPKETSLDQLTTVLRAVHTGHTCLAPIVARELRAQAGSPKGVTLTPRELDVLRLIAADRHNDEIAAELCVCVKTIESHVSRALGKLGVRSRAAAVMKARDLRLL